MLYLTVYKLKNIMAMSRMNYSFTNDYDFIILPTWTTISTYKVYNPDKYDLVEKKDYKIKDLKKQIEVLKGRIEVAEEVVRFNKDNVLEYKKDLTKLEQELKELEK